MNTIQRILIGETNNMNFTCDSLPNTHLTFTSEGLKMRVTLNIEPKMRHFLSPNNVIKQKKFYTYSICKVVVEPSNKTLLDTYNELMQRAMIRCREAKIAVLENEIKSIDQRKIIY